eukprot:3587351-Rhodomonas_salina.2
MSGTGLAYGVGTPCAMSGTDLAHGAICYAMSGIALAYRAVRCAAMSGTDIAYAPAWYVPESRRLRSTTGLISITTGPTTVSYTHLTLPTICSV